MQDRAAQHINVLHAAKEAGVQHLVYTSVVQADKRLMDLAHDHAETEQAIKESGLTYTILRNTFYTEFLPLFLGNALESGQWYFPSNGQKANFALRTDMAEATANLLAEADKHRNKTYEITSDQALTLSEVATLLSEATGKTITYTDVPVEAYKDQLVQAGLPMGMVMMTTGIATGFSNGALDYTDGTMETLLGRKPTAIQTFMQQF